MLRLSPAQAGMCAMIAASTIWGLSAMFYKMLAPVPVLEVLAHRTVWSSVFFCIVLGVQGRLPQLRAALRGRGLWAILAAAVLISANWFGFIFSVQVGRALEASLGYYTFPLVAVALGMVVFGDRLRRAQALAVALATLAVLILCVGLGAAPWIALFLAATFGFYGMVKKLSPLGPLISTTAEVVVLLPLALLWLACVHAGAGWGAMPGQGGGVFGTDPWLSLLLILSGPMTGAPLMLFSFASKRISMASLGLIQYLNPTLQFAVAVLVFGELFTPWHAAAFALIWSALALYSGDGLRRSRSAVLD